MTPFASAQPHQQIKGFTLIELMVVVTIVGILAALSYPSYREHVARTQRALAKSALLDAAQWLERQYTVSNSYIKDINNNDLNLPQSMKTAPPGNTTSITYNIIIEAQTTNTKDHNIYSLKATRAGTMLEDRCGDFVLNHKGEKTITGSSTQGALLGAASCWDR